MERKYLDLDGMKLFAKKLQNKLIRKQRELKNTNWIGGIHPGEFLILDNSTYSYSDGQVWWITLDEKYCVDDRAKNIDFIVITGSKTAKVAIGGFLSVSGAQKVLEANSTYLFRFYGFGSSVYNGKPIGKRGFLITEKL